MARWSGIGKGQKQLEDSAECCVNSPRIEKKDLKSSQLLSVKVRMKTIASTSKPCRASLHRKMEQKNDLFLNV